MMVKEQPWRAMAALVVLTLGSMACGSAKSSDYYTLRVNPSANSAGVTGGKQLGVALPQAAHLLRQDRLVYFTNDNQLNFYQYHRWAESPVFMVRRLLIEHLRARGGFGQVVPYQAQKGLDYLLRGRLLAMEEVDEPDRILARFGLELELVRQEDEQVVWMGRDSCQRPVERQEVAAVVEALSGCAQEILGKLSGSLAEKVSQLESKPKQEASP